MCISPKNKTYIFYLGILIKSYAAFSIDLYHLCHLNEVNATKILLMQDLLFPALTLPPPLYLSHSFLSFPQETEDP